MNSAQIESALQSLVSDYDFDSLPYELLLAYGQPKSSITRLQRGSLNLSKAVGEIIWKKKLYYKAVSSSELQDVFTSMRSAKAVSAHDPRFVIASDGKNLLAQDTKTGESLDIEIKELPRHFDFFLPWAGIEKFQAPEEREADVKAAEKMARLYDELRKDNPYTTESEIHNTNVFLSRLLFCFFAEDTGIFKKSQFTAAVASHTQQDGSDLSVYLDTLFEVLDQAEGKRSKKLAQHLSDFPYVNGGLFRLGHTAPTFSRKSRQMLIESGELDWSEIHPDIFGSMIQAVIAPEHRGGLGMHYTSVPNIMKLIEPLFLDELNGEFEAAKNSPVRLNRLLDRIAQVKIFDPACGSGNFLIIAYKELRLFEIKVLKRLKELSAIATGQTGFEDMGQLSLIPKAQQTLAAATQGALFSRIELNQFYGIELDDFAHEIAILSLWLAEHQMNLYFKKETGAGAPTLPLKPSGNIVHGNATRLDWEDVCQKDEKSEVFILGNPPYLGSRNQVELQKEDMKATFVKDYKSLDYISCWLIKAASYIYNFNGKFAFVSTNSVCQGEQVALLWPRVLGNSLEILFAHTSFKWSNNAKANAAVIVVIIGVANKSNKPKRLYNGNIYSSVTAINPYLTSGTSEYIKRRSKPITRQFQRIVYGNLLNDNGHLTLSEQERQDIIERFPAAEKFIRLYIGSKEYLRSEKRFCLYIEDVDLDEASQIPVISQKLANVSAHRQASTEVSTQLLAPFPHKFYFQSYNNCESIIIPRTSSERREYIPIGFLPSDVIISDAAQAIYNPQTWIFGVISSRMHMVWVRAVAGRLKSDYRYSSALCYNTFPFPQIGDAQKTEIEMLVMSVIEQREQHSEKTLAQLYDPEKMPQGLRAAHHQLDIMIDRCYRTKSLGSDQERLDVLFALYKHMMEEEHAAGELHK